MVLQHRWVPLFHVPKTAVRFCKSSVYWNTQFFCAWGGSMMAAFSEGLAVADKAGLSTQTLLEVLVSHQTSPHPAWLLLLAGAQDWQLQLFAMVGFVTRVSKCHLVDLNAGTGSHCNANVQNERAIYDWGQIPDGVSFEASAEGYASGSRFRGWGSPVNACSRCS